METNCLSVKKHEDTERELGMKENINSCNELMKEKVDSNNKANKLKKPNRRSHMKSNEIKKSELLLTVTAEDLKNICDQLSIFNTRVQSVKEVIRLRYDLPNELQEKLEVEAEELGSLYRELQDTTKHLEIIQNQRMALVKEKLCIKTQLDKLKADTVNELEVILSVYDSDMMERWEAVKGSGNITAVDNLLLDVKGKLQAMKNLQILGTQKLAELKNEDKKKEQNILKAEKKKKNKDTSSKQSGGCLSVSNIANSSQTSLPFLPDTDSEEFMDDSAMHSVLYNLVCDQVLSLPSWTQGVMDID